MQENQEQENEDQLKLINLLRNLQDPPKKTKQQIIMNWLGSFCAYGAIILCLWVAWNYALCDMCPVIPKTTPFKMLGLWYLSSVLLKNK